MNELMVLSYLERIGAVHSKMQDEENLNRLILCHLYTVPFENLDVVDFGLVPDLKEEKIYDKIVTHRRGGYCFEQNTLFEVLLKELGYNVYPVAVRVMWNRDYIPPLSHMGLVVQMNGKKYYCDVGFGGPGPKGLLRLEESEQEIKGETFRVKTADDDDFLIERLHHGAWKTVLRFTDHEVREADFMLMNFYCARNESVLFATTRVLNLCTSAGSKALTGSELTVRENGTERKVVYGSKKELEEGLRIEFGIEISLPDNREEVSI